MIKNKLKMGTIFVCILLFGASTLSAYEANKEIIKQTRTGIYYDSTNDESIDSPWPMKCHDLHHTSRSPYNTSHIPGTVKWRFQVDWWGVDGGAIVDNDGIIYFGERGDYLYALYPNGSLKWKYKIGNWIWSTPAIDENGTIYIGSYDAKLYALNQNGTLKWKKSCGGSLSSSPAIAYDGTIIVGTMNNDIRAINSNGTFKWNYETGYKIVSDPAIGDDGTIYIGSGDSYLYALNPNGTLKWRFKTGDIVKSHPSIASDGTIYFTSFDNYLYALNPDGSVKWKRSAGLSGTSSVAIDENGILYYGGADLYAVYPDGSLKWSFDLGDDIWVGHSSPAISAEGIIYIGTHIGNSAGGELVAVNNNGTLRWRKHIANWWVDSSPCIAPDGTIYIGSSYNSETGFLHAFGYKSLEVNAYGPYTGIVDLPVEFTGLADGGYPPYNFIWNFGDGNVSYERNPIYTYTHPGNYTVTLTVIDDTENSTSDTTWAYIRGYNTPPSTPEISGPIEGRIRESQPYTFLSVDPEDDDVSYTIKWGDGITSEITNAHSGIPASRSHEWVTKGIYVIQAKAIDIFGLESDWGTLEVTMPKNKPVLDMFQPQFPRLFALLDILTERGL